MIRKLHAAQSWFEPLVWADDELSVFQSTPNAALLVGRKPVSLAFRSTHYVSLPARRLTAGAGSCGDSEGGRLS